MNLNLNLNTNKLESIFGNVCMLKGRKPVLMEIMEFQKSRKDVLIQYYQVIIYGSNVGNISSNLIFCRSMFKIRKHLPNPKLETFSQNYAI